MILGAFWIHVGIILGVFFLTKSDAFQDTFLETMFHDFEVDMGAEIILFLTKKARKKRRQCFSKTMVYSRNIYVFEVPPAECAKMAPLANAVISTENRYPPQETLSGSDNERR